MASQVGSGQCWIRSGAVYMLNPSGPRNPTSVMLEVSATSTGQAGWRSDGGDNGDPGLVASPVSGCGEVEALETYGEHVVVTETRVLDHDLEAELKRPVCLQVVAGPRNQPPEAGPCRSPGRSWPHYQASPVGKRTRGTQAASATPSMLNVSDAFQPSE